ncbi:hypothetical protein L9F63_013132, partial [Diploptera punctata]
GVFIFYLIFFSALAILFAICMKGMLLTIDERRPTYLLDSSIIGSSPGLGFRPMTDISNPGALIWYQAANETNYMHWVRQLESFLEPYKETHKLPGGGKNQQLCDYDRTPDPGKVCAFDVKPLSPCTSEFGYGYNKSAPCVFIKLNKIYDWVADYYRTPKELPEDMPLDLKEHINDIYLSNKTEQMNQIWVSCKGEHPADRQHIGPIKYYPGRGFPGYYYPYQNIDGYLSPLIAVMLERPELNVHINIECRAWAKNIAYSNQDGHREGSVHFELMID